MTTTSATPTRTQRLQRSRVPARRRQLLDRSNPLGTVDRALQATLGADLTLIYGMAAPILMMVALIVAFAQIPSWWMVGALMMLMLGCLGFIITKVMAILADPENS